MTRISIAALRTALAAACIVAVTGCASSEQLSGVAHDPWESPNRTIYTVNDAVDRVTLKPIAKGYDAIMPGFARKGISNFADNLTTPRSAINNFLQGKPRRGFQDIGRFLFNSTVGIGGLLDLASASGLEEYNEDFGQTLAVWGVPDGPYVYLPLFGPRTLRDAIALPVDIVADPLFHYDDSSIRDKVYILRGIDLRTRAFTAEKLLEGSKDPYITIRESYIQNRRFQVFDGDPPEDDDFYDEFFDEEFDEESAESADEGTDDPTD